MSLISLNFPTNGRYWPPTGHFLSHDETSNSTVRLHLIELLAKEMSWKPQNNPDPGFCQHSVLLYTNWWQGPITEDTYITNLTQRILAWSYKESSLISAGVFSIGMNFAH